MKVLQGTDIDKTYEIPKYAITYRKQRKLSVEQRMEARSRMNRLNEAGKERHRNIL